MKHRIVALGCLLLLAAVSVPVGQAEIREVVLLHTNDFHSAIDPVPAFWMEGTPRLGGAAHLMTMIRQIREREARARNPLFLFDAGDMFTGMLSRVTKGEVLIEMMITMGYDAMGLGNHEFDYGVENCLRQSYLAPFPILSANTYFRDSGRRFMRPHAILEKDGFRIGVIGIIGQDAMSVVLPSLVSQLEFRDPAPDIAAAIRQLEPKVDLIVVLAHQGRTGPMQSDAEAHPEVQRDFQEDIDLTSRVPGIDVFLGGHAHRGIERPYVNPKTGSIIVQTYGYGTRLAFLRLHVDTETGRVVRHEGRLLKTYSDDYPPDPLMARKMQAYKDRYRDQIARPVGQLQQSLVRVYNAESSLGNFVTDVMRTTAGAELALTNAGGLRADLPQGTVTNGAVRDALPFLNTLVTLKMTGAQIKAVLEQSFSLNRGMMQASGIEAVYDLHRPVGKRLLSLEIAGRPAQDERSYRVAVNSFVAEGGDLYSTFKGLPWTSETDGSLAEVVMDYLRMQGQAVAPSAAGRLIDSRSARR